MALFGLGVGSKEASFIGLEAVWVKERRTQRLRAASRRDERRDHSHLNELERDGRALAILGSEGAVATLVPGRGPVLQRDIKVTLGIAGKPVGDDVAPGLAFVMPGAIRQLERQVRNAEASLGWPLSSGWAAGARCLAGGGCAGVTCGSGWPGDDDGRYWAGDGH